MRLTRDRLIAVAPTAVALLAVVAAYVVVYLTYDPVPGNSAELPRGWWGWWDQSQYLRSAAAFSRGDLGGAEHWYPPLYSLVAAPFCWLIPNHPFVLVDLAALAWSVWVFLQVAGRLAARWVGAALVIFAVVANPEGMLNWVIPWTSSAAAVIVSTLIWLLLRAMDAEPSRFAPLAFGLVAGLLLLTRPLDVVAIGPLAVGYAAAVASHGRQEGALSRRISAWVVAGVRMAAGVLAGLIAFLAYNYALFGSPRGGYLATAGANGYFPSQWFRKVASVFVDGQSVYLEPGSAMVQHYPWLLASLVGLCIVVCVGGPLRWIALAVAMQFVLYLPYGDLTPTGLWLFHNVHYFKWTFPYLALLAWLAGVWSLRLIRRPAGRESGLVAMGLVAAVVVFALIPRITVTAVAADVVPSIKPSKAGTALRFDPVAGVADFVDVSCIAADRHDVLYGRFAVTATGRELRWVRDFRVLSRPGGIRLLFTEPTDVSRFRVRLPAGVAAAPCARATFSTYRVAPVFR